MGSMDAETGDGNHTHVVIRCYEFENPSTKYTKEQFTIKLQTNRYTYKGGPMTILEQATVNMDEDMRENPGNDPTPTPAYVDTIVQAECGLANDYSSYFPIKELSGTNYRIVPNGLVAFVNFGVEML